MTLKNLPIKIKYDSDEDDILNDFYIPVLSGSCEYNRIAGFFSSSSLAIAAMGLEEFIKNNGKMKLICSAILSREDYVMIKEAHKDPIKIIEDSFISDLNSISDNFVKDNISALGWMIANGNLEIKIAIPKDARGLFHSKMGIFKDEFGDFISFSGSDNETESGWKYNIEEFKVFKSWLEGQEGYAYQDLDNFDRYWLNLAKKIDVVDVPIAIKEKLIKLAPNNIDDVVINDSRRDVSVSTSKSQFKLREYQEEAIKNWFDNDKKGIFEMATGTGKTFTAIGCLEKLKNQYFSEEKSLLIVIVVPTTHLVDQWEKDILKFDYDAVLKAYSSNGKWKEEIYYCLMDLKVGLKKNLVVLTTHKTFASQKFKDLISKYDIDSVLVVDEVHGIGSPTYQLGLIDFYNYRLGLSATPIRWYDDLGNEIISEYFGDIVYEFSLSKALREINPDTGKTFLTQYYYCPIFVNLNQDEIEEYLDITYKIARYYAMDDEKNADNIDRLLFKRQRLLNKASNKYSELRKLIRKIIVDKGSEKIKNIIIYCHDTEQVNNVLSILNDEKLVKHSFTGKEKIKDRKHLLNSFSEGKIQILVAMKCLDEGVDVPSAELAIIMASTSNPREYIQRRGRILRRSEGKEFAKIYDMIVNIPKFSNLSSYKEMDNIIEKESDRYLEFASGAKNHINCLKLLEKYFKGVIK